MRWGISIAVLSGLAVLASCATMSADECAVADWRSLGYQDGGQGLGMLKFTDREKACAKAGIAADLNAYQVGRQEGLVNFCQPQSGFRAGLRGYSYQGACPSNLEADFLYGYTDGRAAYDAIQVENDARNRLNAARSEQDRLSDKIAAFDSQARDGALSQEAREDARRRANELRRDRDAERDRERDADRDLLRAGINLDRLRSDLSRQWGAF
jgi:hypothetical protein